MANNYHWNEKQFAVRLAMQIPKDGRTQKRHLDVIWANFGNFFSNKEEFLQDVKSFGKRKLKRERLFEEWNATSED